MKKVYLDFVQALKDAPDLETSLKALSREIEELGFAYVRYGFAMPSGPVIDPNDTMLVGAFCDEWEDAQKDRNWMTQDYVVQHCSTRTTPLTFSRLYSLMDDGHMTKEQEVTHGISREIGMEHGIAVPLRDGLPVGVGGMSFCAFDTFSDAGFAQHLDEIGPDLLDLSELFHSNLSRGHLLPENCRLSPRERECLLWLSAGLRVDQIAFRLGNHPKTVEKQISSARHKLRARTNAQAVARALTLDLLNP